MGRTAATIRPGLTPAATPTKSAKPAEAPPKEGHRESVEAIVVAFILALVVRGFEAQAFVIPTGSMAPTLMGRHKELNCPQCGFLYTVNASEEVEGRSFPRSVYSGICVNCRYQARGLNEAPSFKGDRILVSMFPYDLPFLPGSAPPERWDVVVFRYPEEPEVSYIKRLIGLPGETVRITHGDVYIKRPGGDGFQLERKPLRHQAAMQMTVHDDRHRPKALADQREWDRWQSATPGGWKLVDPGVSRYQAEATQSDQWTELKYQNLVPDPQQWDAILSDHPLPRVPRSTLITDYYSYNTNLASDGSNLVDDPRDSETAWLQPHWVGDLTLSANVEVLSSSGQIRLELIKGGVPHRCDIDLQTGATIFRRGDQTLRKQVSPINGPGKYQLEFANVDDRMVLWVNGKAVDPKGVEYDRGGEALVPTEADLAPARIALHQGSVIVSDLVLKRDIYYTLYPGRNDYGSVWDHNYPRTPVELFDFLSDPTQFPSLAKIGLHDYELGVDRFMMLGDNSPRSKDSRGWDSSDMAWDPTNRQTWEVPRNLLTGKAFYVYWPHGVPFGPDSIRVNRDIRPLFRPYVERMRWIR